MLINLSISSVICLISIGTIFLNFVSSDEKFDFTRTSNIDPTRNHKTFRARRPDPLEPLTSEEINATSTVIKRYMNSEQLKFLYISLKEPEKSLIMPYFLKNYRPARGNIPRKSFVVLMDKTANKVSEAVVNLDNKRVESWNNLPEGYMPLYTPEEEELAEEIARTDPNIIERSRQQGWTNMTLVTTNTWPMGYTDDKPQYSKDKRLCQLYFYGKNFFEDNQYAHPFDFGAVVDLLSKKVIEIHELPTHDDYDGSNKEGTTVPKESVNYDPDLRDPASFRMDLKPVQITQERRSYSISGKEIRWQNYKMRVGFNAREGLVLYTVNYNDNGRVRPLFYRMSLVEIFTAYGDPRDPYYRKVVSDESELGVGFHLNSLRENRDCVGEARFFDAFVNNEQGRAVKIPRAMCLVEEDDGVLWKHSDFRTGKSALVRSQRLALLYLATIGNYEYIFTWRFYLDGTIEFNVKLSGILSLNLLAVNATPIGHGQIVSPQINAQYHQHFFSLRLDPEIDGPNNTVIVSDVLPGPGTTGSQQNPYGKSMIVQNTPITTAAEGRTRNSPRKSRVWWISNPSEINSITKQPVAWRLTPHPSPQLMIRKESPYHSRIGWLDYNTWVLPYKEDQVFPGGYYLNNSGLPEWVEQDPNANTENTDIVLWHNFGVSHIPRMEDFPVMPTEQFSILLKPYNFFKENPALDVPPPKRNRQSEEEL